MTVALSRSFLERFYPSADKHLTLFARDYPSPDDTSDKTPLLMMHGLTRNSADFEPLISHLDEDRRTIVPDQRGRGRSEYDPDPSRYRPDVYVEDMWALLDRLEVEKVICIGTSMGGLMSMVMGAQKPDRVSGIVLNDIGPAVSAAGLDRIRSYVGGGEPMADWDEAAARCEDINGDALDGLSSHGWLEFARRTCEQTDDGSIRFAYDPAISESVGEEDPATIPPDLWAMWELLSEIPLLTIRGAKSDILAPETLAEMARRHTKDFSKVEVPGRGHAPLLDEPAAVQAIRSFLSDLA